MRTLRPVVLTGLAAIFAASVGLLASANAALTFNALTFNALTFNALTFNALTFNGVTPAGTAGGVVLPAVHGLTLPSGVAFALPA